VGGKSFKRKKKKLGGGRGENKVPKTKTEIREKKKKNWEGGGEKIKLQKKTEIRAEKGQTKKCQPGMAQG
jgi:hypothetical protein